jgi:hypothetical protein
MLNAWLLALAALLAASRPAAAQVSVSPVRDLAFGPVIVGIPTHIPPSHPVRSGQFRATTPAGARVRFRFSLPNRLVGPGGATLPISFGAGDGIATATGAGGTTMTFRPGSSPSAPITSTGTVLILIGGTVSPTATQQQGDYTGTITLTLIHP